MGGHYESGRVGRMDWLLESRLQRSLVSLYSLFFLYFLVVFFILFYFLAVIMGELLCLDRAQVNTYGSVMIQDGAAAHDSPHTTAKAATLMFASGHEC